MYLEMPHVISQSTVQQDLKLQIEGKDVGESGIFHKDLGMITFEEAFNLQFSLHKWLIAKKSSAKLILFCEHPPVITLGKNGLDANLLFSIDFYTKKGISVLRTDRGGQATVHSPGQLVVYLVFPVKSVRKFVAAIEEWIIRSLKCFQIKAERDPDRPGVWVDQKKICSLGIRMRNSYSYHGLALNICNDLSLFSLIHPCGMPDVEMTRMAAFSSCTLQEVREVLLEEALTVFRF